MAATVHAQHETTYEIINSYGRGRVKEVEESYVEVHDVAIPVWIRNCAVPADQSAITPGQFESSGADLWVSVTELRRSDLTKVAQNTGLYDAILKQGHHYEWLCLGAIAKRHITCVMPWDGKALHSKASNKIVWSKSSPEKYVFDWMICQWRLDPTLYALGVFRDRKAQLEKAAAREKRRVAREKQKALKAKGKGRPNLVAVRYPELTVPKARRSLGRKSKEASTLKRKHALDKDGNDMSKLSSEKDRSNSEVWDLMITAQEQECHCNKRRHVRSGSAQL